MNFRQLTPVAELSDPAAQHLAAIVECARDAIASQDNKGIVTSWNAAATQLLGFAPEEIIGKPFASIFSSKAEDQDALKRALNAESIEVFEAPFKHKTNGWVSVSSSVSLIRNANGNVIGTALVMRPATDTANRSAEHELELLLRESHHRIKNTLAMIHAIAGQTFREAPATEKAAFASRLQAMGSAHDLLIKHDWNSVQLQDIVTQTLAPFRNADQPRFAVEGPPARLEANEALFLAIILHELATNAVKYGALSTPAGHITVLWSPAESGGKPYIDLVWREANGPAVTAPGRNGFGTTLLRHMHNGEGGGARIDFDPAGVVCRMKVAIAS